MSELDDIKAILRQVAENQATQQQQQQRTQEQIEQLATSVQGTIQDTASDVVSMIGSLAHDMDALSSNVNAYIAQSTAFLAAEQRDRSEFRQQMVGLQTETRNILRELADLRRQQENGN